MYGCESWTMKKAWVPKNGCFWTVVLDKTFESPWTAKRSNQSILNEISPGCSLEGLILRLKLQSFGHLMRRADSLKTTLMLERLKAGGEGDGRGWDGWTASLTRWTSSNKLQEMKDQEAWCAAVHGVTELDTTNRLNNIRLCSVSFYTSPVSFFFNSVFLCTFPINL